MNVQLLRNGPKLFPPISMAMEPLIFKSCLPLLSSLLLRAIPLLLFLIMDPPSKYYQIITFKLYKLLIANIIASNATYYMDIAYNIKATAF